MQVGFKTHTGHVRANNEDAFIIQWPLLAVADGMGGHAAGEVASAAAVQAVAETVAEMTEGSDPGVFLKRSVLAAQQKLVVAAAKNDAWRGMGTTLTAAWVSPACFYIAHVGDSRAYVWRDGALRMLTTDHSVAAELARAGQLTEQDAAHHPQRHVLTRAVSAGAVPEVDMITAEREPHDTLLLCTDGLTTHVDEEAIGRLLQQGGHPQNMADELVQMALDRGGSDNVTVIVAGPKRPGVIR